MREAPRFRIQTLFYWCNDVAQIRHFYTDLIGLDETFYKNDDEAGWLNYQIDGVDVVFMRATELLPIPTAWARQPGYQGGTAEASSWIIAVPPNQFDEIVGRLQSAEVPTYWSEPAENQFFVQDPMGTTVEIFAA